MGIAKLLAKKLTMLTGSLLVASLIIFWVANTLPGDVAQIILGTDAAPGEADQLRTHLGLNRPWLIRYSEWVLGVLHGNFGNSYLNGNPVAPLIWAKITVTTSIVVGGIVIAILIAIPLGVLSAIKRRRWSGFLVSALSQIGLSIPSFWAGILLVLFFAVKLNWLPANGYVPFSESPGQWFIHLILPVFSLGIVQGAVLSRYVRNAVVGVLEEDFFRTARAVGFSKVSALLRHGARNASLPVITVIGLQVASLLTGAIIIEQVYALPGLGSLLLSAVSERDLVMVQAIVLLLVVTVLVINAIVDISYRLIDPRLRDRANK